MADEPNIPLNPDLAGYPTAEALVQGYRASGEEAKRLREQNQKLTDTLSTVLTTQAANPRQHVDRSGRPEDRLTDMGVPVEALNEFFDSRLEAKLAPIARGMQARQQLVGNHPDYAQYETDVANFIAADPDLSARYPKLFDADPAGAMEYAFLKFGESRRRTAEPPNGRERINDAQIPSSRTAEGRNGADPNDRVQAAFEQWQRTGSTRDAAAFAQERLHGVIKDAHLNA